MISLFLLIYLHGGYPSYLNLGIVLLKLVAGLFKQVISSDSYMYSPGPSSLTSFILFNLLTSDLEVLYRKLLLFFILL